MSKTLRELALERYRESECERLRQQRTEFRSTLSIVFSPMEFPDPAHTPSRNEYIHGEHTLWVDFDGLPIYFVNSIVESNLLAHHNNNRVIVGCPLAVISSANNHKFILFNSLEQLGKLLDRGEVA